MRKFQGKHRRPKTDRAQFRAAALTGLATAAGIGAPSAAWAVTGDAFEYHSYMRAGTLSNLENGSQACPHQPGVPGNEFRLGNECGIYGESYFQAYAVRPKDPSSEFFRANFDFAFSSGGKLQGEPGGFSVFGAFIEAGRFQNTSATVWAGRRYYRDTDIHMDDLFYFADTSAIGAGVQDIRTGLGDLSVAVLTEASSRTELVPGAGGLSAQPLTTENGVPRVVFLDVRLFDIPLDARDTLNVWTGVGTMNGGTSTATGTRYANERGWVFGVKEQYLIPQGYNRVAVIHGHGVMQGLNLGGPFGAGSSPVPGEIYGAGAGRWRLVEDMVMQPAKSFAIEFAAIYETWNADIAGYGAGRWISVGARPQYFFTDHISVAVEVGGSTVRQAGAGPQPSTPLFRGTFCPQITPKSEYFSRPALRAFLTDTFGRETSYGIQGEVWF